MIRVLHVLNNLGSGGAESFVMNVYRNIDRSKVQFDFLIRSTNNGPMVDEIKAMGGEIFILPAFPRHVISNYRALNKFIKERHADYMAIHVHANSLVYVRPLKIAKKYGIPKRIIHSHSTVSGLPMVHKFNISRIDKWVTDRFACSNMAGEWMFPGRKYTFIPNGIDINRFKFNAEDRENIRRQYGIGNRTVIGNVGRFTPPKNHSYIISVFSEYHKEYSDSVLMLVGDGEDREKIEKLVKDSGLADSVLFVGAVPDVWRYLSAMDVFLLPSLWEGLAIVLIEAQTNGLRCVAATTTPPESNCGGVEYMVLETSPKLWAERLSEMLRTSNYQAENMKMEALKSFDIRTVAHSLQGFYLG